MPPTERKGHSAVIYGDDMYVFGGEDKQGNSNDFFSFNFARFTW